VELYRHSLNAPSWRGAQLKQRYNFIPLHLILLVVTNFSSALSNDGNVIQAVCCEVVNSKQFVQLYALKTPDHQLRYQQSLVHCPAFFCHLTGVLCCFFAGLIFLTFLFIYCLKSFFRIDTFNLNIPFISLVLRVLLISKLFSVLQIILWTLLHN
jgi:hypothetical protein